MNSIVVFIASPESLPIKATIQPYSGLGSWQFCNILLQAYQKLVSDERQRSKVIFSWPQFFLLETILFMMKFRTKDSCNRSVQTLSNYIDVGDNQHKLSATSATNIDVANLTSFRCHSRTYKLYATIKRVYSIVSIILEYIYE